MMLTMSLLEAAALTEGALPFTPDIAESSPPTTLSSDFCPLCPPFTVNLCVGSRAERTLLVPAPIVLTNPTPGLLGVILDEVVAYRSSMSLLALTPLSVCVSGRLPLGPADLALAPAEAEAGAVWDKSPTKTLDLPPIPVPVSAPVPPPLLLPVLPGLLCSDLLWPDEDEDAISPPALCPTPIALVRLTLPVAL